jgi:ubiquinone/menaquinone biosynthesis C-methylase UbiE
MPEHPDVLRLRTEYASRGDKTDRYSLFNPAQLFLIQQRQRAVLSSLRGAGIATLKSLCILEVGCGAGGVLAEFLVAGASPENLYGVDLLPDRLSVARTRLPGSHFANADGSHLPFREHSFDLVMQFTALSSILDDELRDDICLDMLRVLKPNGLIVSYDFWLNPTNRQTHGIRPKEIRKLFPSCSHEFHKITLAPPIARRIVPVSWILALSLEKLGIFNSHYLVAIHPR